MNVFRRMMAVWLLVGLVWTSSNVSAATERFERLQAGWSENQSSGSLAATGVFHPTLPSVFVAAGRDSSQRLTVSAYYGGQADISPPNASYTSLETVGPDVSVAAIGSTSRVIVAYTNAAGELGFTLFRVDGGASKNALVRLDSHPTPIKTGASRKVEIVSMRREQPDQIVMTAIENADGNGMFQLDTWKVNADHTVVWLDREIAGDITDVVLASDPNNETAATATINTSGEAKLILWSVASTGMIDRRDLAGFTIGTASEVAISLQSNRLNVAQRTASGLHLKTFAADFLGEGSLTHKASYPAHPATSRVEIADHRDRMLVAVRSQEGKLKLIAFDTANNQINRMTDNEIDNAPTGDATLFSLVEDYSGDFLFTPATNGNSLVRGITWQYHN